MWESDTMDGQTKYLDGNKYALVLSNGTFFTEIYPMYREMGTGIALKTFITELRVP